MNTVERTIMAYAITTRNSPIDSNLPRISSSYYHQYQIYEFSDGLPLSKKRGLTETDSPILTPTKHMKTKNVDQIHRNKRGGIPANSGQEEYS